MSSAKHSNKSTCNVSIKILTQRLINCPNHILHTWNLLGFSAISEKVEQEVRATIAKAPLQCIRGCYLFIIPPDFYNTMSLWTIFVAHQRSAQVLQCRVTQAKDLHWSRYHSDVNHFLHCGHQISESGCWPICEVACIMLLGSSNFSQIQPRVRGSVII